MNRKLRVLCLHGHTQNEGKFRRQTGGMRKFLKQDVDFFFTSAPHILPGDSDERTWWFSKPDSFSSRDETNEDTGFATSLNFILDLFKNNGPFDGILGFSQGAALAGLLCSMKHKNEIPIDIKFAIIASGFKSKCSKHAIYYEEPINIPSLHVIGETDEVVYKHISEALAAVFVDPVILRHGGGHHVPAHSSLKDGYRDFIQTQKNRIFNET